VATNQHSQRRPENVDTVGVTGSIPVSPTMKAPGFRGLRCFCGWFSSVRVNELSTGREDLGPRLNIWRHEMSPARRHAFRRSGPAECASSQCPGWPLARAPSSTAGACEVSTAPRLGPVTAPSRSHRGGQGFKSPELHSAGTLSRLLEPCGYHWVPRELFHGPLASDRATTRPYRSGLDTCRSHSQRQMRSLLTCPHDA
jgi:hypothetical protein